MDQSPALTAKETLKEAAHRVRSKWGQEAQIVCILGAAKMHDKDSEALVKAIAQELGSVSQPKVSKLEYVTGGCLGVQKTFAEHFSDGSRLWNLLPMGQSSNYGKGKDIHAGADSEEKRAIFGLIGDVYITVEGGPGVAEEARAAHERGAVVVPLRRSGGASAGECDFPEGALERPSFATEEQWSLLANRDAPVEESAAALAEIVRACIDRPAMEETPAHNMEETPMPTVEETPTPTVEDTPMPNMEETSASTIAGVHEAAQRVRSDLGQENRIVCVLGGARFYGHDSEALVKSIARRLRRAIPSSRVKYVTGGCPGVQETFAKHFPDDSCVWNLLPMGQSSNYGKGKDIRAGADSEEKRAIFGLIGDVYITVEGGPGVAEEARAAHERGAVVVPLRRSGGASAGECDFPEGALEKPSFATEEQWSLLANRDAPVEESAAALADIVRACVAR